MRNGRIWCSAIVLGLFAGGVALGAGDQATFVNRLDNSMRERAALTRFRGHVPVARMGSVTLAQAIATISDGTGLRIHVDWPALSAMDLSPETPVNVNAKVMSFGEYMNAVCGDLGVGLLLYFRRPANEFCLTAAADSPVAAAGEKTHHAVPEAIAVLGGKANASVAVKLSKKVGHFDFAQVGFANVIGALQKASKVNIWVNWTTLQAAGIDKNTPVTIKLSQVPADKVLTVILSEVGGGAAQIAYTISDGVVQISTRDDLNGAKYQVVHLFDIRRLLAGRKRGTSQYDDTVKDIVDTIKTTVAADSWRDAGGAIGSIRELNGQLIVNQTRDNEVAIYKLLRQMKSQASAER